MNTLGLDATRTMLEAWIGSPLRALDPDSLNDAIAGLTWSPFPIPTGFSDTEIAEALGLFTLPEDEELFFLTDASFIGQRGAFVTTRRDLPRFFEEHFISCKERVFSGGDVILWSNTARRIWSCHHEGVVATATLPLPETR